MMNSGQILKAARLAAKLSMSEAARRAGISRQQWYQYERDLCTPSIAKLEELAAAINCKIDILITPR